MSDHETTSIKRSLRVLTNSERTTFRRCQREHHYAYRLGVRSISSSEAQAFGTVWHHAQEARWNGRGLAAALEIATREAADEYEAAKLRALLHGYEARWHDDMTRYDVRGVEVEFRAPLINPETSAASRTYELGGKIDVLLARSFVEHKTTSSEIGVGSNYWRRLTLDPQVTTYYAGAKALGVEVDECIYDVVRKPAQRPSQIPLLDDDGIKIVLDASGERVRTKDGKKWRQTADAEAGYVLQTRAETSSEYEARLLEAIAEDPNRYYQRGTIVRLESEEKDGALDAWQIARSIRDGEIAGRYPRNPDGCERYGSLCAYLDVCTGLASLDDPTRYRRVERVHEELSADGAQ